MENMNLINKPDKIEVPIIGLIASGELNFAVKDEERCLFYKETDLSGAHKTERMVRTGYELDIAGFDADLEKITIPKVMSYEAFIAEENSLNHYERAAEYYKYTPRDSGRPLVINDLSVISNRMVITKDYIVSRMKALPLEKTEQAGFNSFFQLVTEGEVTVDNWTMTYRDREFLLLYSDSNGNSIKVLEISNCYDDLAYRYALYIIGMSAENAEEFTAGNCDMQILVWSH